MDGADSIRAAVVYAGRVQGVGFRAKVRSLAAGWAVTGWVRNEPNGAVRLEAQGAADQVEGLLGAIRAGLAANIAAEDRSPMLPAAAETGFEIRFS